MSAYDNVVTGKLKLKGKPLDVKSGGKIMKKKKKHKNQHYQQVFAGNNQLTDVMKEDLANSGIDGGNEQGPDERLTPAERRYLARLQQLEMQRLAKSASKSHRDRIQEFNQYLANLTEHYDIPKVGPG